MSKIRIYYMGLTGTTYDLEPHPYGVQAARRGEPFEIRHMQDIDAPGERSEYTIIPKEVRLPAGSLNFAVRVWMAEMWTPISPRQVPKRVGEDVERGDTRGMFFVNPAEEYE